MPNNWTKCKLGDILNFRRGHDLPKTEMKGGAYPVIGSNGIIGYHNKFTTENPCLVIGRSGNTGKPALYETKCWAHNTTLYIDDYKGNNPKFLFYFLQTLPLSSYSAGSAVPTLNRNHIHPLDIEIPKLDEQKRIAGVLGAFDDKIELLQKQNKTLEDMAKAIFKSWFVDFDIVKAKQRGEDKQKILSTYKITEELYNLFPSSFTDAPASSSLGPIPTGWEVKLLGDISKISAGKRPQETTDIKTAQNQIPVYGGNGIKWYTNSPLFSSQIIITGRVGTLGEVYRITNPCWVSDNAIVFNTDDTTLEFLYNTLLLTNFEAYNRGSTQPLITQSDINEIGIPFNKLVVEAFHNTTKDLYGKIDDNKKQIQTLTELRDSLLPRLLSGKLQV